MAQDRGRNSEAERLLVLVIDDNIHMRAIIKAILRAFGITQTIEASDGAEALDLMNTRDVDLVIVDYAMPIIDGIEFIQMVRTSSDSKNPYVPIIMVSGHSSVKSITSARDVGVTEFMVKPVTAKGLYERIVTILDQPMQYIRSPTYFGPDRRRRRNKNTYNGPERRKAVTG